MLGHQVDQTLEFFKQFWEASQDENVDRSRSLKEAKLHGAEMKRAQEHHEEEHSRLKEIVRAGPLALRQGLPLVAP